MMHESPLICPLMKITPRASAAAAPTGAEVDNKNDGTSSSGFTLGKPLTKLQVYF